MRPVFGNRAFTHAAFHASWIGRQYCHSTILHRTESLLLAATRRYSSTRRWEASVPGVVAYVMIYTEAYMCGDGSIFLRALSAEQRWTMMMIHLLLLPVVRVRPPFLWTRPQWEEYPGLRRMHSKNISVALRTNGCTPVGKRSPSVIITLPHRRLNRPLQRHCSVALATTRARGGQRCMKSTEIHLVQ